MGYRLPEDWCDMHPQHIDDVANTADINVDNGTITRFYIPCSYVYEKGYTREQQMIDDHLGWPSPDHPDDSAQSLPPFETHVGYIDMEGEGYSTVEVGMSEDVDGLSFTGIIDGAVVTLVIDARCASAQTEDVTLAYSVYAVGSFDDGLGNIGDLRDVVAKGTLRIIAGPIPS